jgi:hypothetical protein
MATARGRAAAWPPGALERELASAAPGGHDADRPRRALERRLTRIAGTTPVRRRPRPEILRYEAHARLAEESLVEVALSCTAAEVDLGCKYLGAD